MAPSCSGGTRPSSRRGVLDGGRRARRRAGGARRRHGVADGARRAHIHLRRHEHHRPGGGAVHRRRLAERGIVDARCAGVGRRAGAINAALTIMVGGDAAAFERVQPLFEAMGKSITRIGDSGRRPGGQGLQPDPHRGRRAGGGRGAQLRRQSGVDAGQGARGAAGRLRLRRILENHGQRMLDRNFKPGFKAWMHQKDCASSWTRRTAWAWRCRRPRPRRSSSTPWSAAAWARNDSSPRSSCSKAAGAGE
jgi:hypothetical protein